MEHNKGSVQLKIMIDFIEDRIFSRKIVKRDKVCRLCYKNPATQVHHLINRSFKNVRYNMKNGIGLCIECHIKVETNADENAKLINECLTKEEFKKLWDLALN